MGLSHDFLELANNRSSGVDGSRRVGAEQALRLQQGAVHGSLLLAGRARPAVDTHHIKFQSMADARGFIGHLQKNHKSNLIPLCKECHMMAHNFQPNHTRYQIHGYQLSSTGIRLDCETVTNAANHCEAGFEHVATAI